MATRPWPARSPSPTGRRGRRRCPPTRPTSRHEAHELRDGGDRYAGRGVTRAVANVTGVLAAAVTGTDAADQPGLDARLREADGTPRLSRLGANAVLAVSIAAAHAVAASRRQPLWAVLGEEPLLPLPMINIISGGAHAGGLIDVQDLLAVPVGARSFREALEWAVRVRAGTAAVAADAGLPAALVADEGGIAGPLGSNRAALDLLMRGIERSGLRPGEDVAIAIDVAASQLLDTDDHYRLHTEDRRLSAAAFIDELVSWCDRYPIVSLEDVLGEDDWDGWTRATRALRGRQLLGDDLFATDLTRLERGIQGGVANAVLIKPNQTGTLTAAAEVVGRARGAGYATVVSARSGDTEDSWLADLAVGWRAGQIKVGSTTRSERTAKWNRLLRIEAQLSEAAPYAAALPQFMGRSG